MNIITKGTTGLKNNYSSNVAVNLLSKFSKFCLSISLCFSLGISYGQNVGVNKTGTTPNASAILDLNSGNGWTSGTSKGLLIPNIALTGIHDNTTILSPATSLLVYNTATGGGVTPGYYYNANTPASPTWTAVGGSSDWLLLGNSGTTAGTNFVGTTDANDLVFKTNSTEDMRIAESNGNVGINEAAPKSKLDVNGNASIGTYAGVTAAPTGGLTVSGQVGIGTATPTVGSALEVASTTEGVLIPRMPSAPTPVPVPTSLLYYDQTKGCFMFYNGTGWQPISCVCNGIPATPTISGPTTFCPAATGSYTITNASSSTLYYNWTVPTGTTITSGQGTSSINVTYGSTGGSITAAATGSCGISNAGTYAIGVNGCVPITITNTGSTATVANLPVMIIVDFTNPAYTTTASPALNSSLNNVEFTTQPEAAGTPLDAWIESGTAPTAATSTETMPTSSSSSAVVWVNLGSTTIAAGASTTIYMNFMPSAVMLNSGSVTGMAPQWYSTSYGQYDNGTLVFPIFYDNFAGVGLAALASKWSNPAKSTVNLNNDLQVTFTTTQWVGIYTNTFGSGVTGALGNIAETYCEAANVTTEGACINTSGVPGTGNGINTGNTGVDAQLDGPTTQWGFGYGGSCSSAPTTNVTFSNCTPVANTFYVLSFWMLNTPVLQISYGLFSNLVGTGSTIGAISASSEVGLGSSSTTSTFQWFRMRPYPPGGAMPSAVTGTYGCY